MTTQQQSDNEELRLLFQVTTADLAYFKTQQWAITYYSFLVDAALIGVAQLLRPTISGLERFALACLALLGALAAMVILAKLEKSISVRRSRLDEARSHFGSAFQRAWAAEHKGDEYVHSIYVLYGGVVLTSLLTMWLLACRL